ncbi:hypothetical protein [Catellatospora sp. NPDC049609]|uniref:hypothetical protein n=1 Tax=Catellatospora sp. NPDC049609 TaxID=3155505 RepID=UPI003422567C
MREEEDVRAALAVLVADEPDLPSGAEDIERRGVRRRNRRYALLGALALSPALAGAVALGVWPRSAPPPQATALPPASPTAAEVDPAGGTQLATGFPLGSAVDAVAVALPAGVSLAELPMDLSWQADGSLALPLTGGGTLTVTVAEGACTAAAPALSGTQAVAVADAVCAAWRAAGSPPIVPTDPDAAERPDLAAQ